MTPILILVLGCLFGMFLHFAKKALYGELWPTDNKRNPLTAQFWRDWAAWLRDQPGYTAGSIVACVGTAFVLSRAFPNLATADVWDLIGAGVVAGWVGDCFNRAGGNR